MSTNIKFDERKYNSDDIDRSTSANSHNSNTIIKYIIPRVISPNISSNLQGSLSYPNINTNYPPIAPTHGLAALVQMPRYSTLSAIHSIDGERTIDELRELSRVTETFGKTILDYCNYDAHNRALQSQINWLENHGHENSLIIEKKFQTEMESAQRLINESSKQKPILQTKFNDLSQTILISDQEYQQLLTKRNLTNEDLFNLERQIAQNNAESQFLKRRIQYFDDQIKFYILKNRVLYERKVRLRYDLDEQLFSHQGLKIEYELLEKDKITSEDTHMNSFDDIRQSIDIRQVSTYQPSKTYSQQLNQQIQHIRNEYEQKLNIYREELHRRFELELHRYQIQKSSSLPMISREHQFKFEQYQHENIDVQQQIAAIRGSMNQVFVQIETLEKQIEFEKQNQQTFANNQLQLQTLNQIIQQREKQLDENLKIRNQYKNEIDNYRKRVEHYSKTRSLDQSTKRITFHEWNSSPQRISNSRLSLQDLSNSLTIGTSQQPKTRSSIMQIEEFWEEGTLTRYADFNLDSDCQELHNLLTSSDSDEHQLVQILCNRSIGQRLQIRDRYKTLFQQTLGDGLENLVEKNLSKLLRVLLLSPIERDCFEIRRILKGTSFEIDIFIELFFARTIKHIQAVKDNYMKLFRNSIEDDLLANKTNSWKQLFLSLLHQTRSEDNLLNDKQIELDARNLYETKATWTTDQSIFIRILSTRNNSQLKQIFACFQQFNRMDFEDEIRISTDEKLYPILLAIVRIVRNRPRFFAYQLQNLLQNISINIDNLNRIIVSHCEIDMVQIKHEYEKLSKRTLYEHIQMNTTGNYKRGLLELIRQRIEPIHRQLSKKTSDEQTVVFRHPQTQRIGRVQSDTFLSNSSNQALNRQGQIYDDDPSFNDKFDSNHRGKSSSLVTRTNPSRPFTPLPTTLENHSPSNHDED